MRDYADDAVVVRPDGIYVGQSQIRKLFAHVADKNYSVALDSTQEAVRSDVVVLHWTVNRGTSTEKSGEDAFVIRDGKIVFQGVWILSGPIASPESRAK